MEIILHEGLGEIKFGHRVVDVEKAWGEPDEVENLDDEEGTLLVWHFDEKEVSLSFDPIFDNRLVGIASSDEAVELNGEKLVGQNEISVIEMLEKMGIDDLEGEELDSESKEVLFISYSAGLALFFEGGILSELKITPEFNEETEEIVWPA